MRTYFLLTIILLSVSNLSAQEDWQYLIGKNLSNWKQLGGTATYTIQGNSIIGKAVTNSPNSFLTTKEQYSDFVLEFDFYLDNDMNSGVQIRSNSLPDFKNGRVHGYQVEIDPSKRAFSGGIYDEARRLWLYPISRNPQAHGAFVRAAWNKVHIEAIGSELNTWINGIHCASLVDDLTASGFIGLQVHDIGNNEALAGVQAIWRDLRIATQNLEKYTYDRDPSVDQISFLDNRLTDWEVKKGWRLLWDGQTSAGWRGAKLDGFPESGWDLKDGVMTVIATEGKESAGPGDIITLEKFRDFELIVDFKITEGANSGIKYFVDPSLNKGAGSAIGCEYQILDDSRHPDAKEGVNGNRTVASLYDLIAADNLSVPGRGKQFFGIGMWNRARIVSKNGIVEHWLNGELAVTYDRNSQLFDALVAYSKYKDWDQFGRWPEGHILLQDHGNEVSFKNIKIREL